MPTKNPRVLGTDPRIPLGITRENAQYLSIVRHANYRTDARKATAAGCPVRRNGYPSASGSRRSNPARAEAVKFVRTG